MMERGDYRHKDRYPDPPAPPSSWSGWRRKKGSTGAWEEVQGSSKPTKGECYQALMQLSELVGTAEPVEWEYTIVPGGQKPAV